MCNPHPGPQLQECRRFLPHQTKERSGVVFEVIHVSVRSPAAKTLLLLRVFGTPAQICIGPTVRTFSMRARPNRTTALDKARENLAARFTNASSPLVGQLMPLAHYFAANCISSLSKSSNPVSSTLIGTLVHVQCPGSPLCPSSHFLSHLDYSRLCSHNEDQAEISNLPRVSCQLHLGSVNCFLSPVSGSNTPPSCTTKSFIKTSNNQADPSRVPPITKSPPRWKKNMLHFLEEHA